MKISDTGAILSADDDTLDDTLDDDTAASSDSNTGTESDVSQVIYRVCDLAMAMPRVAVFKIDLVGQFCTTLVMEGMKGECRSWVEDVDGSAEWCITQAFITNDPTDCYTNSFVIPAGNWTKATIATGSFAWSDNRQILTLDIELGFPSEFDWVPESTHLQIDECDLATCGNGNDC